MESGVAKGILLPLSVPALSSPVGGKGRAREKEGFPKGWDPASNSILRLTQGLEDAGIPKSLARK
jgi:hypothetical protein